MFLKKGVRDWFSGTMGAMRIDEENAKINGFDSKDLVSKRCSLGIRGITRTYTRETKYVRKRTLDIVRSAIRRHDSSHVGLTIAFSIADEIIMADMIRALSNMCKKQFMLIKEYLMCHLFN